MSSIGGEIVGASAGRAGAPGANGRATCGSAGGAVVAGAAGTIATVVVEAGACVGACTLRGLVDPPEEPPVWEPDRAPPDGRPVSEAVWRADLRESACCRARGTA